MDAFRSGDVERWPRSRRRSCWTLAICRARPGRVRGWAAARWSSPRTSWCRRQASRPAAHARSGAAAVATAHDATALKLHGRLGGRLGVRHDNERGRTRRAFVELAHERRLVAIAEGIVAAGPGRLGDRVTADELLEAAVALSEGADLYKAQVPISGGDDPADVERLSLELRLRSPVRGSSCRLGCPRSASRTCSPRRVEAAHRASSRGARSGVPRSASRTRRRIWSRRARSGSAS